MYEVCKGFSEWVNGGWLTRRSDFSKWIREFHQQLDDRLASYYVTRDWPEDVYLLLRILQSDRSHRFNFHQPGFISKLFYSRTEILLQFLPVRHSLVQRIEAAEQAVPGTLAPVLRGMTAKPDPSDPNDFITELYLLVLRHQFPPSPSKYLHYLTSQFLFGFIDRECGRIQPGKFHPDEFIRLMKLILKTEQQDDEVSSNGAVCSPADVHMQSDRVHSWNRPTLLPGVTRRSFLLAVENMVLCKHFEQEIERFEATDSLRQWWISTSWCCEEVCWPLEILQRARANGIIPHLENDDQWILRTEDEQWQEIIAPIVIVFQSSTSILSELVVHEILPFLRVSSYKRD